jgi:hypothetical protein
MRSEFAASVIQHEELFVVLWLHTAKDPPLGEWATMLEELSELRRARQLPLERIRQLVVSDGGAPNALQRTSFAQEFARFPLAVITPMAMNPLKRGIITALSWMNPCIRLYEPRGFSNALDYLELSGARRAVWEEYQKLALRVKPQITLKLIEAKAFGSRPPSRSPSALRDECDTCAPTACTCLPIM